MTFDGAFSRIDWGFVYVASEWARPRRGARVRAAAPPAQRGPRVASAHLLPAVAGVVLYLLIGRA
jgi:hypothetical protein